ncbi:MAG: fatty acid desaturase [Gammaproteobacteria bacterium]|nr:fatty acid desaturase [Gammaproteobacteria bacterium]
MDSENSWTARLAKYKRPDNRRALIEIAITVGAFVVAWAVIWGLLKSGYLLTWIAGLLALVPAAGLMLRLFIIQHDCGHGSLFTSKRANDWLGRVLGVFTFTPYEYWRLQHAGHHASSGNLDRRGIGDIDTLTVDEYLKRGKYGRLLYRLYRHPVVLFGLGPSYMFILRHRLPIGSMTEGIKPWIGTLATNVGIVLVSAAIIYFTSWQTFLLIQIPIVVLAATFGMWLFYVQHQFDNTHWSRKDEWDREASALHGSSFYDLPKPLMWISGNVGIHHVHHLSSRIPFHKLPQVMNDYPELKSIGRLTLWESFKCVNLSLWDEERSELVSFKQLRQRLAASPA